MGIFAAALLTLTVLLLLGAEWPRLSARFGAEARDSRARGRRKREFTLIEGDPTAHGARPSLESGPARMWRNW
jgi:hypothetical protein